MSQKNPATELVPTQNEEDTLNEIHDEVINNDAIEQNTRKQSNHRADTINTNTISSGEPKELLVMQNTGINTPIDENSVLPTSLPTADDVLKQLKGKWLELRVDGDEYGSD
eukprot:371063_1